MEKTSSISSSKFISSTLDNVCLNSNISLTQMKEAMNILDTAIYAAIIPILKIQNKIESKFDILSNEVKDKQDTENNENTTHSEESKSENSNTNDNQQNISKMISFCEDIRNNTDLFTQLSNSEEYENIIKSFNELIPDSGMFIEKSGVSSNPNINNNKPPSDDNSEKSENNKKTKDNINNNNSINPKNRLKKNLKKKKKPLRRPTGAPSNKNKSTAELPKKPNTSQNLKNNINKILENKTSHIIPPPPKISHSMTKKQQKEIDMLNMIQKDFPTNAYIQRISKTFLSRRLFKKVTYQHIFNYYENGSIDDKKVKTVGESAMYKNCKATFKFMGDKIKNTEKIDEMMGKELRQEFAKLDEENCEYIIAGKIGCSVFELIQKIFKRNLLKELSVVNATLEFYEFYEELISEFDENDDNVRIIFCDENILKHVREDWKNLQICRNYVRQKKIENAI